MKKPQKFGPFSRFLRGQQAHEEHEENCTALCCALSGQSADILYFVGDAGEAAMLRDLGVREGARVTVVRDGDPLVVKVDNARFGIGRSAATQVICRIVDDSPCSCKPPSTR